ncbi:GNAT family N-acetyltransferase [Curtobacterium sp. 9128]|uniref:GNAT family N-acetyltransferase n=1 Tax=Curtobacterium sp. 9128 TaxID=1793722 RepID=UPI0016430538|nr:GNAT family protein [Curtobacterium sp. 9128]
MDITVEPVRRDHAAAIVAAEDAATIRWLSGGRSTVESTAAWIDRLDADAAAGAGKRAFAILADGACVGTIDYDPDLTDGLEPDDVNIAYGIAPWMRGKGLSAIAVEQICDRIRAAGVGTRAAIRAEVDNRASARVAERAGFTFVREFDSAIDVDAAGRPVRFRLYVRPL